MAAHIHRLPQKLSTDHADQAPKARNDYKHRRAVWKVRTKAATIKFPAEFHPIAGSRAGFSPREVQNTQPLTIAA
jgi:hypothetical protein